MRDLFTKDLGWKLFSLIVAVGIWLTVSRILHESALPVPEANPRFVTYDDHPVTLLASNVDARAFLTAPAVVKITIVGPDAIMSNLKEKDVHAFANLSGMDSLAHGQLLPVEVSLPPKVTVDKIEPDKVLIIVPSVTDNSP